MHDDEELEELADLYGVSPAEVDAMLDVVPEFEFAYGGFTEEELRAYIDDLYDKLVDEGYDLDVSDLWDIFYGYTPGVGKGR